MMMRVRRPEKFEPLRYWLLGGFMLFMLALLGFSLWKLQVKSSAMFESRIEIQSLRRVRLPGIRGKIYDRNGLCLADNRPIYSISLFLEDIRRAGPWSRTIDRAMDVINQVSELTGLPPELTRDDVWKHIRLRLPLPLVLWRQAGPEAMAKLAEQGARIPGVDLYIQATRTYPYSPYTSHLIGYVGRADPEKLTEEEEYSYYLPTMFGRAGLEKLFDPFMQGKAGGTLVQIDVSGYRHGELARRESKAGGDLRLTLDMEIQLLAHKSLGNYNGAVVVMDPNNGDVLAMISAPGYDANMFVPFITTANWNVLRDNANKPLLNRAVAGTYPPGSVFKPLVGLAAATVNPAAAHEYRDSPGFYMLGRRRIRDWNPHGHGEVNLREALKLSANVYFLKTALEYGWQPIIEQAKAVGLGQKTGVEVDFEQAGLVPDTEWLKRTGRGNNFTDGDVCNLSIGQGYLTVTPVQMAMMTSAIANGGYLYKPRVVLSYRLPGSNEYVNEPERHGGKMNWPADAVSIVRAGMRDVIMERNGTGHRAAVPGFEFAGKTGTAEYGANNQYKHTWMIGFAPYHNPQYAVAMIIEDGGSGGSTVGPQLKILMSGLYEKMKREGRLQEPQNDEQGISNVEVNEETPNFNIHYSLFDSQHSKGGSPC
ncbi:MAG: penicillin-binding protein 2 [Kiritimatiellales bacterium]